MTDLKTILFRACAKAEAQQMELIKHPKDYTEAGAVRLTYEYIALRSVLEQADLIEEYKKIHGGRTQCMTK